MGKLKKTLFLTGGTGSLGYELVKDLSVAGFNLYFSSRNQDKITQMEREFSRSSSVGGFVKGVLLDFSNPEYIIELKSYFESQLNKPEILINNVRNLDNLKVGVDGVTDRRVFLDELELGIFIPYQLAVFFAASGLFKLENIINISSMYGIVPPNAILYNNSYATSPIQYGVAKAGLIHLTKELAVRFADNGIRVNCISYGGVGGRANDEFREKYAALTPMKRMIDKSEVSGPVKFLISENSSGMTGQNIIFDGGYTVW